MGVKVLGRCVNCNRTRALDPGGSLLCATCVIEAPERRTLATFDGERIPLGRPGPDVRSLRVGEREITYTDERLRRAALVVSVCAAVGATSLVLFVVGAAIALHKLGLL